MSEWIPVTEQMPPTDQLILTVAMTSSETARPRLGRYTGQLSAVNLPVISNDGRLIASKPWWMATHWMRIPGTEGLIG